MASLNTFLTRRQVIPNEDNLAKGEVSVFCPGTQYNDIPYGWCWNPRANGTVIMEAWGSGGSGAKMCCCGGGLPGNSGAYIKKYLCVTPSTVFCGTIGFPCGNSNDLCFRGCSEATCWYWANARDSNGNCYCGCICAQGGLGGTSHCSTGTSLFCCFAANGFCGTVGSPANCGLVCNYGTAYTYQGQGYISCCNCENDLALGSAISCTSFFGAEPSCICLNQYHIATPPGLFSKVAGNVTFGTENDNQFSNWSGMGHHQSIHARNALSRFPNLGIHWTACWQSTRSCGCYDEQGCGMWTPIAWGGTAPTPCVNVRDHAGRGGLGAVKFTFYPYYFK